MLDQFALPFSLYKYLGWREDIFQVSIDFLYIKGVHWFVNSWLLFLWRGIEWIFLRYHIIILATVAQGSFVALLSNETKKKKEKKLIMYHEIQRGWWNFCSFDFFFFLLIQTSAQTNRIREPPRRSEKSLERVEEYNHPDASINLQSAQEWRRQPSPWHCSPPFRHNEWSPSIAA